MLAVEALAVEMELMAVVVVVKVEGYGFFDNKLEIKLFKTKNKKRDQEIRIIDKEAFIQLENKKHIY